MNEDIRNLADVSTLIAQDVPSPVAPSTQSLAPDVRETAQGGLWRSNSAGAASDQTASAPGAPGATQRSAFVMKRDEPASVPVPALGKSPGE